MPPERRAGGEVRVAGRTLTGTAMRYGDVSPDFRERFEPGAFGEVRAVDLNLQHDPGVVLVRGAALTDGPQELSVRATLPDGSAALALVKRGALSGFSIEFNARSERRDAGGIRVVERADLTGLALVDRGAYPGATAEVRARSGQTVRQRIPSGKRLGCACSGAGCKLAQFMQEAMTEMLDRAFADVEAEILAVAGSYGRPLASKSAGSVRAKMVGANAVVEVDLPTGPDGDAVLRDIENTGAVLVRPYLDRDLSKGRLETRAGSDAGGVIVYDRDAPAVLRSFVVGATDMREGWPSPDLIRTPDELMPEGRAAAPRRRRLWL